MSIIIRCIDVLWLEKSSGDIEAFDFFIHSDDIALFFKNMNLTNKDKRLLIKDNLVDIFPIFAVQYIAIDLSISAGIDINPCYLLVNVYLCFRIVLG